jgi:hypothetical protein
VSDPFGDLDETLDDASGASDASGTDDDSGDRDGDRVENTDEETVSATAGAEGEPADSVTDETTGPTADDAVDSRESATEAESDSREDSTDERPLSSPAFPFAAADQTAVYPRAETWAAFEDFLDFEVRRRLREAGVRDDTKRELHEAALQVIRDHPEAVAEQFLDNRQE